MCRRDAELKLLDLAQQMWDIYKQISPDGKYLDMHRLDQGYVKILGYEGDDLEITRFDDGAVWLTHDWREYEKEYGERRNEHGDSVSAPVC